MNRLRINRTVLKRRLAKGRVIELPGFLLLKILNFFLHHVYLLVQLIKIVLPTKNLPNSNIVDVLVNLIRFISNFHHVDIRTLPENYLLPLLIFQYPTLILHPLKI